MQQLSKMLLILLLGVLLAGHVSAGETVVYVTTLATSYTSIGQRHSLSGLFLQTPGDTTWDFLGRTNNRVYNVDVFRPEKGKLIALATHTGVHQSWDYGKTWKVTSDWRMTEVNNICFHRENPNILYASSPYGFYKTTDNGKTWKQYNDGLTSVDATYVSAIVPDLVDRNTIFISTEDGVYVSENAGESWTRAGLNVRHIRTLVQHPENPNILLAGTEHNGLYVSLNRGVNWEKRDTGILHETFYCITFDPANPEVLYAGGFQTGVYKSIDGGRKWKQSFKGLGDLDVHAIAVDPNNSDRVYAGTIESGVYYSSDGGKTWEYAGIDNGYVWAVKIISYEE